MVRLVEPPPLEIVAEAADDHQAELQLLPFGEVPVEAGDVGHRLLGDGAHDRHKLGSQLAEQRAYAGDRHALVQLVDQRVGDVVRGSEVLGILPAEGQRLLQEGPHGGEIVGRSRPGPGVIGG
jgi:hypothetical protein